MTTEEQKTQIDLNITDKSSVNSITPADVGGEMKSLVDYIDSVILKKKITLTPLQINNLGTTPIELLPAPGPDKIINVFNAYAVLTWNSQPYDNNLLTLSNTGSSPWYLTFSNFLSVTQDTVSIGSVNGTPSATVNAPLLIGGTDSVSQGDSTILIYVTYNIITLQEIELTTTTTTVVA